LTVGDDTKDDNADGLADRVYRFIGGPATTWKSSQGVKTLLKEETVRVESTFSDAAYRGRIFEYVGENSTSLDLTKQDYSDNDKWKEVDYEEDLELWKEDYADETRWELAPDYADPETLKTLREVLIAKGFKLAKAETIKPKALYKTSDGQDWDYSTDEESVELNNGDLVRDDSQLDKDVVYKYLGKTAEIDLSTATFTDTKTWEKQSAPEKTLRKGNTVEISANYTNGGKGGAVYEYIGVNNKVVNLAQVDFSDEDAWKLVEPTISISVVDKDTTWKITDADGKTYLLSKEGDKLSLSKTNINALSVAASAAIGVAAGGSGMAFSGAGAVAVNRLSGSTDALMSFTSVKATEDVKLTAESQSKISATVASLSAAIAAGSSTGVGASIGISVARNLIGKEGFGLSGDAAIGTIRALIEDSQITTDGKIILTAEGKQTIDALVFSGSAALAGGGGTGLAASGSGVWAENQIGTRIHAGADTATTAKTRPSVLSGASILVGASDTSSITAFAGAASLAAAFGGGTGAALSVGVSLARNVIDGFTKAEIAGAKVTSLDTVTVLAVTDAKIKVFGLAASLAAGIGGATGVGVSGAGASALNIILGDSYAGIRDSAVSAAGAVSVDAYSKSRIEAVIISASVGIGGGGATGVGASIGVSIARNYIGYNPYAYSGEVTYTQGTDTPSKIVKGDKIRLGPNSGARANEVYEYIGAKTLYTEDKDKDGKQDDLILAQDFSDTEKWKQLINPSANEIWATVTGSSISTLDDAEKTLRSAREGQERSGD